jgi:hypothetical protein
MDRICQQVFATEEMTLMALLMTAMDSLTYNKTAQAARAKETGEDTSCERFQCVQANSK